MCASSLFEPSFSYDAWTSIARWFDVKIAEKRDREETCQKHAEECGQNMNNEQTTRKPTKKIISFSSSFMFEFCRLGLQFLEK